MTDLQIKSPITLPCGLTLPNRLVKAAMVEYLAKDNFPTELMHKLYLHFADGDWGMVITGNVQVDPRYLGSNADPGFDVSVGEEKILDAWRAWARDFKDKKTALIMQLNHPGRQAIRGTGKRSLWNANLAPSALAPRLGKNWLAWFLGTVVFGTPREMTHQDIEYVTLQFQKAARTAHEAGFAGVEIHAAHGYLLSQFLSAKGNVRADEYGGTAAKRAKIVVEIIRAIREVVPASFCVGIKLNSVDHQSEQDMAACVEQLELITKAGVDFLEISGGDYEEPTMFKAAEINPLEKSDHTKAREAFFLDFAKTIRAKFAGVPLIVTGGFRTRRGMESAVAGRECDMIGMGRPAAMDPELPRRIILNEAVKDDEAVLSCPKIEAPWVVKQLGVGHAIGAGAETTWYSGEMRRYAKTH